MTLAADTADADPNRILIRLHGSRSLTWRLSLSSPQVMAGVAQLEQFDEELYKVGGDSEVSLPHPLTRPLSPPTSVPLSVSQCSFPLSLSSPSPHPCPIPPSGHVF